MQYFVLLNHRLSKTNSIYALARQYRIHAIVVLLARTFRREENEDVRNSTSEGTPPDNCRIIFLMSITD
jgi:hypothetical protein